MKRERVPDLPPGSGHDSLMLGAWRSARVQIGAALAAHGVASALTGYLSAVPLVTAIAATLTFASAWLYGARRRAETAVSAASSSNWLDLYAAALTAGAVAVGAWMISAVAGDASAFYCAPEVPWRIEIALFGSIVVGLSTAMAHVRRLSALMYPLTLMALLWIAPYYGYFSGAVYLGLGLVAGCPDRSVVQLGVTALGMVAGKVIGNMLANWLSNRAPDDRDARP